MNKDRVEGKVKDAAGRVQRQAGEWADSPEQQVKGAAKQAEGKAQNAWGQAKDAAKEAAKDKQKETPPKHPRNVTEDEEAAERRRTG
jgi:uncharacterized protein YjbJ (UPF0337 family)